MRRIVVLAVAVVLAVPAVAVANHKPRKGDPCYGHPPGIGWVIFKRWSDGGALARSIRVPGFVKYRFGRTCAWSRPWWS